MADQIGNTAGNSGLQLGGPSEASTGQANEESQHGGIELPAVKPSISAKNGNSGIAARGKNFAKNQRKKRNKRNVASSDEKLLSEARAINLRSSLRLQIGLVKGLFNNALMDELLRDLNVLLYQTTPGSFIPTFFGFGLRYGKIWFSPENQESHDWLKQKLMEINEKAIDDFKFIIEPFNLHRNNICLSVPWNANEDLSQDDVLNRLNFQNPAVLVNTWRVNKINPREKNHRLLFCSISDDSLNLLKKQNFMVNYGFQKIFARSSSKNTSSE